MEDGQLRLHLKPVFGDRAIGEIRRNDVVVWLDTLRRNGEPAKSINNHHGVLVGVLGEAVSDGLIDTNPAASLPRGILPKSKKRKVRPLSSHEVASLLWSENITPDHRVLYALAAFCGMREGEVAGRRWKDLQAGEPLLRLHIHTQYQDRPVKGAKDEDIAERYASASDSALDAHGLVVLWMG